MVAYTMVILSSTENFFQEIHYSKAVQLNLPYLNSWRD